MPDSATQDDINEAVKSVQKRGAVVLIVGVVVLSVMWFFWPQIAESVRTYDAVKRIPEIEKTVDRLDRRMERAEDEAKRTSRDVKELQDKTLPRVPSWNPTITKGGS